MIPNDTEVVILLKKGTKITAVDSHGKTIPSCPSCTSTTDINPVKMLVTLNQDGSLGVIDTQAKAKSKAKTRSSSAPLSLMTARDDEPQECAVWERAGALFEVCW